MSNVPKIVRDRLQASVAVDPHPEADMLTAFAEHSLSSAERQNVMGHLSRCRDCREVVALSSPAMEEVAVSLREVVSAAVPASVGSSRRWFVWPNMRWAALAAGVAVVASVALWRPGIEVKEPKPVATVSVERSISPLPTTRASNKPDASPDSVSQTSANRKSDVSARRGLAIPEAAKTSRLKRIEPQSAAPVGILADSKRSNLPVYGKEYANRPDLLTNQTAASVSEQVEVSAGSPEVPIETTSVQQAPVIENRLQGKLEARAQAPPPITKAKPPAQEEKAKAGTASSVGSVAREEERSRSYITVVGGNLAGKSPLSKNAVAQWSLAQGVLRRSLDGGSTWQSALQLEHPLLSFGALGAEVWAGGQGGTLFRSSDNGMTWAQMQPSVKAAALSGDIVAIDIQSPTIVVLSTSNHESWSTADGGKTWENKTPEKK